MFNGYLSLGGVELVNSHRFRTYMSRFLPGVTVRCEGCEGMHNALGHAAYTTPNVSGTGRAPWYRAQQPDSANFYGFFPLTIAGIEDSTQELNLTELAGHGAAPGLARHTSKEIRVRGIMYGKDSAALAAGMTWLRSVLADEPCGQGLDCGGRELQFFTACPGATTVAAANANVNKYGRVMYDVEVLQGVRIVEEVASKAGAAVVVEFVLVAGVPWIHTFATPAVTTTGVTPTAAPEVYCAPQTDAYSNLVLDPNITNVKRPPRPPLIEPIKMPASWNRYTMNVATTITDRNGVMVPTINLHTGGADRRMVRVRFYRAGNSGSCDYEGEFLVTYAPSGSRLEIDSIRQKATLVKGGVEYPAGNLVLGSNGRPAVWPAMACDTAYHVVVDSQGSLGDARVTVDLSVRE
jgi:hypothetical protein